MTSIRACCPLPLDSEALWAEVQGCITFSSSLIISDDTTLDTSYASQMALGSGHWSGKHYEVGQGVRLISPVWSNEDAALPYDYRLYNKVQGGLSKNDHFRDKLQQAQQPGFQPALVAFDSWYSSLDNLKWVRNFNWDWLTRLKSNRQVSTQPGQQQTVSALDIPPIGVPVHRWHTWVSIFNTKLDILCLAIGFYLAHLQYRRLLGS